MLYVVRGETTVETVTNYLAEALEFCRSAHDSGGLCWQDETGYVQWAGWPAGVQIECSSEQYMDRAYSSSQLDLLGALGFSPPNDDIPNYWRRITEDEDLADAVTSLVGVLFEVLPPAGESDGSAAPRELPSSAATDTPPAITVPAVMFRISRLWYEGIDEDDLYDATHGWWVMGPKRERAEYAFAVANGHIKAAYRIHGWRPRRRGDDGFAGTTPAKIRWGFDGEPCDELEHLVGLDVRGYFPQGAANPVRYVNCDDDSHDGAAASTYLALSSTPESESRLDALERTCKELQHNPMLHMSLNSKELFHSNFLGWLVEAFPAGGERIFAPWLHPDASRSTFKVRREAQHLDLIIELPGYAPIVIENKMFSLPDEDQLDDYAAKNIPAAGVTIATRLLLSLNDPGWSGDEYEGWLWVSYGEIATRARDALGDGVPLEPFAAQLLARWIDLVDSLETIVGLTSPKDLDEPMLLDGDQVEILRTVRLHDAMQKARTRRIRHRLEQQFAAAGLRFDFIESAFSKGAPLLSAGVDLEDGSQIGWQLQGSQFRRYIQVPEHLSAKSGGTTEQRVDFVRTSHPTWFDFIAERGLGSFASAPNDTYKHFKPRFVYDYIKVGDITVGQILTLGESTLRAAIDYQARLGGVSNDPVINRDAIAASLDDVVRLVGASDLEHLRRLIEIYPDDIDDGFLDLSDEPTSLIVGVGNRGSSLEYPFPIGEIWDSLKELQAEVEAESRGEESSPT